METFSISLCCWQTACLVTKRYSAMMMLVESQFKIRIHPILSFHIDPLRTSRFSSLEHGGWTDFRTVRSIPTSVAGPNALLMSCLGVDWQLRIRMENLAGVRGALACGYQLVYMVLLWKIFRVIIGYFEDVRWHVAIAFEWTRYFLEGRLHHFESQWTRGDKSLSLWKHIHPPMCATGISLRISSHFSGPLYQCDRHLRVQIFQSGMIVEIN